MPVCVSFQTVDIVDGHCGRSAIGGQSDWLSCFEKESDGCPHGFIKIKKPTSMNDYCGGYDGKVCCLIVPRIQIKVKTIVMIRTDNYTLMMAWFSIDCGTTKPKQVFSLNICAKRSMDQSELKVDIRRQQKGRENECVGHDWV